MATYARLPVSFERGAGANLWDSNGKQYLDAIAGIAVCSLGHARREVADAICDQANTLVHTSNLYQINHQSTLGDKLCELSGLDKVFFSNSGAEANEAAIKLARKFGNARGIKHPEIIVASGSFHGRTLATLSATGNRKIQAGFEPLVQGFVRVPYNDTDALDAASNNPDIVAVLVEPVQGEGGVIIPDENYLTHIRQLCDNNNWLMILDEIQTGMGRTGKWFAFQHTDIKPDVITLAKALGNGVPIGACLAGDKAADIFTAGSHGSTFGGNPLACRAALAVVDVIESNNLCEAAAESGAWMLHQFKSQLANLSGITEIRGKGLMVGIELEKDCSELVSKALSKGLLINVTAGNVIRLLPPLIISREQANQITTTTIELIQDFLNK
jgi:acetylornithine aminotransferase